MFGLFKRTKVESWETALLVNVFNKLGGNYKKYQKQIDDNLFVRVRVYNNSINYVGFSYDPSVSRKYEIKTEPQIVLKGIRVFDNGINSYTDFHIYIFMDLVAGYSTPDVKKFKPDLLNINLEQFQKDIIDNSEFSKVSHIFTMDELKKINSSEIYEVELNGRQYYHLKDLEDGDFIGFDTNRKAYKITHDPFEIIELKKPLEDLL